MKNTLNVLKSTNTIYLQTTVCILQLSVLQEKCLQVAKYVSYVSNVFPRLSLESELKRQCMTYMICTPCIKTVKITNQKNVKEGDIIMYLEHGVRHYGVVLKIKKLTNTPVSCTVTYTTSYANKSRGLVETDHMTFRFKDALHKLDFTSSKCKVYHFKYVVKRARKLIGVEMHEFFIKQCSSFPIWCKLNL